MPRLPHWLQAKAESITYDLPMSVLRCVHCNYQLQHITANRCPECGADFDPADELTVNRGRELTYGMRWALAPTGRLATVAIVLVTLLAAWSSRLPVGMQDRTSINAGLLFALGSLWLGSAAVRWWMIRRNRWQPGWFVGQKSVRHWPGLLALLVGVGVIYGVPRWIAFRLSESDLKDMGDQLIQLHKSAPKDQWIGLFHASSIHYIPGGAILTTAHEGDGESGLVYLPNLDPKRPTWNSREYLADGWWTWREPR